MYCVFKRFDKDGGGKVVLVVEQDDDLWFLYNLISKGDTVTSEATRKVLKMNDIGTSVSMIKRTVLTLSVTKVVYDISANFLRVSGYNIVLNKYVKKGQYHTLKIALNMKLTLVKSYWDFVHREKLYESLDLEKGAETAVILIEYGLAHIFLLRSTFSKCIFKLNFVIPKRSCFSKHHENAKNSFFKQLYNAMILHIKFSAITCCLIAGPGFIKEEFLKFLLQEATLKNEASILKNSKIFTTVNVSTAHKQALKEIMFNEEVRAKMENTKNCIHLKYLEKFYHTLHKTPDKACYGPKHVALAAEKGAIDILMLSDGLFRSSDVATRSDYVRLTESVKKRGAKVHIFSDLNFAGEQLNQITGIAAILHYDVPELNDLDADEDFNILEKNKEEEDTNTLDSA